LPIEKRDLYGNPRSGAFDIGANGFTDSDGDSMQDDWEIKHGLNPFDGSDATGNPDNDGFNNLQEYNHNTDAQKQDTDGDGIADGPDPDPTTPEEQITIEWHDPLHGSVWKYWVNQTNNAAWINQPPTQPRVLKLNNYHIGDRFSIQLSYDSGPINTMYFLVPLQSTGALSVLPDAAATPLLHFTDSAPLGQRTPPDPGWLTTVWTCTLTNADVCAGFDDESPKFDPGALPALSVPQSGTNAFSVIINPTSVITQIIFETGNTNLATVVPATAAVATQVVSVVGVATGNVITNTTLFVKGYGAQNSYTTTCARVSVDVLPKRTNVTVAIYKVIAATMTNNPPTNVPAQMELKSYLDDVFGTQANVLFNILPLTNIVVDYDFNTNGALDLLQVGISPEVAAITNAASIGSAPNVINMYFVNTNALEGSVGTSAGASYTISRITFIQDFHPSTNVQIAAHEIGHQLELRGHVPTEWPGQDDRLMWGGSLSSNPCRLIQREWRTVNSTAQ
jgi:hypothetical protein